MGFDSSRDTIDCLTELGFESRGDKWHFDFGNLDLEAHFQAEPNGGSAVVFRGYLIADALEIGFELPVTVESTDDLAVSLVQGIDEACARTFLPVIKCHWFLVARTRAGKRLEPTTSSDKPREKWIDIRFWTPRVLTCLHQMVAEAPPGALLVFGYDGAILTISCGGQLIACCTYAGAPWKARYGVPASVLKGLTRRLDGRLMKVLILEERIVIGGHSYPGRVRLANLERST